MCLEFSTLEELDESTQGTPSTSRPFYEGSVTPNVSPCALARVVTWELKAPVKCQRIAGAHMNELRQRRRLEPRDKAGALGSDRWRLFLCEARTCKPSIASRLARTRYLHELH